MCGPRREPKAEKAWNFRRRQLSHTSCVQASMRPTSAKWPCIYLLLSPIKPSTWNGTCSFKLQSSWHHVLACRELPSSTDVQGRDLPWRFWLCCRSEWQEDNRRTSITAFDTDFFPQHPIEDRLWRTDTRASGHQKRIPFC